MGECLGYHFDVQFGPNLPELATVLGDRARVAGVAVSTPAYDLRPRAAMLRFSGTLWSGMAAGEVRFQTFEYRFALDAFVVQDPCITSKHVVASFGLHEEQKRLPSPNKAVGLWIRNGSLIFREWHDKERSLPEQVLAELDMWQAFDAMARFAAGETSFGLPLETAPPGKLARYPSPSWAMAFGTGLRTEGAEVTAKLDHPLLQVVAVVTPMNRA